MLIFGQLFLTVFELENKLTKRWSQEGGILAKLFFEYGHTLKWKGLCQMESMRAGVMQITVLIRLTAPGAY